MHAQVHTLLRYADAKSGKSSKTFLSVIDADGNRTHSVVEGKLAFKKHFSGILGGTPMTMADLAEKDNHPNDSGFEGVDPSMYEFVVPLRAELRLLKTRPGVRVGFLRMCIRLFPRSCPTLPFPSLLKRLPVYNPLCSTRGVF